ncbi:hypothetical protein P152DRAFT_11375 [Eremomyces bilateralis CBS 781.70]|uniref:Gem-associated protein 5 TPR domain-containing protein n=1 Tax=Eremomyces bilateralis CBS 781.70 TaxID=1392243 RepID=A0A6G1GGL5_9PEZI|nr:uncharacterized protein P152DRAFT_11375 [Eremomyces bilateralis CBS 781.70]KAF1817208.1 hypothetical protein P152DRAFT_11375 [Eremomyces bilateralis CBS 781.70]
MAPPKAPPSSELDKPSSNPDPKPSAMSTGSYPAPYPRSTSQGSRRSDHSDSRHSNRSNRSNRLHPIPPAPTLTPANDIRFQPAAATGSFLLYAYRNLILCLHHDTLAIERRFDRHRDEVQWISVDNISERGAGRLVVSYDTSQTTIVWDLLTGDEVARFASYEEIRIASWMRNGNIAFGNDQGNVILFEPSTSEHVSARTIFDPITALAPSPDCRTFSIGYMNGSILIVTLQPFTILHTLSTARSPSPINGLAWHGSSSKQKSEMLASQTADGDLRVWSIPKSPSPDPPTVIRVLNRSENRIIAPCWFAWSKLGRIVQYSEGQTCVWDVRTKRVTYETVPTLEGIVAITNFGQTATLFTLCRNFTIQQYDVNPNTKPTLVANMQQPPANLPPSPPNSIEQQKAALHGNAPLTIATFPVQLEFESTSEEEGPPMSPLEKIAKEMGQLDDLEDEMRDRLGPLSPVSSRGSQSSRSSAGRRERDHLRSLAAAKKRTHSKNLSRRPLKPYSPGIVSDSSTGDSTVFSSANSSLRSVSTRSALESSQWTYSTSGSAAPKSSHLRKEVTIGPDEKEHSAPMDLFPYFKAKMSEAQFRSAPMDNQYRSPDDLRRLVLDLMFDWTDDVDALIREEISKHPPASSIAVILAKWLGDLEADMAASLVGSSAMSSADWMVVALCTMGQESQRKMGEAFVQSLLAKGDIHPAVALLLGFGEHDEAVEVYVSRKYYMEALLLTCLLFPSNWERQKHLVRKWGESLFVQKKAELSVKCFSLASLDSSEPWFSPRATEAVEGAQARMMESRLAAGNPPLSPPASGRATAGNMGLKLITSFGKSGLKPPGGALDEKTPMGGPGVTPIAESALSPSGAGWNGPNAFRSINPHSLGSAQATATPGGYYRRRRFPSRSSVDRNADTTPIAATPQYGSRMNTPQTAINAPPDLPGEASRVKSRSTSQGRASELEILSPVAYEPPRTLASAVSEGTGRGRVKLPPPTKNAFSGFKEEKRNGSRDRKPEDLHLNLKQNVVVEPALGSPEGSMITHTTATTANSSKATTNRTRASEGTTRSTKSVDRHLAASKVRSIDQYINSIQAANFQAARQRSESRKRGTSREGKERDRTSSVHNRQSSDSRGRSGTRYIKPAKRSPSSPVSMSPDQAALYSSQDTFDAERFYKVGPTTASETTNTTRRGRSRSKGPGGTSKTRSISRSHRNSSVEGHRHRSRSRRHGSSRHEDSRYGDSRHGDSQHRDASRSESMERMGRPVLTDGRGRTHLRGEGSTGRSPSSPLPLTTEGRRRRAESEDTEKVRNRQRSTSRHARVPNISRASASREASLERHRERSMERMRERESSRGRRSEKVLSRVSEKSPERIPRPLQAPTKPTFPRVETTFTEVKPLTKRELAAKELEERRLSLARRPSAPAIPHPDELFRPTLSNRSFTDISPSGPESHTREPSSSISEKDVWRSPLDNDAPPQRRAIKTNGTSTSSVPIGLPATPSAMKHPKYMSPNTENDSVPSVPAIPPELSNQSPSAQQDSDPLFTLPATTYGQLTKADIQRSASVPLEQSLGASATSPARLGARRESVSTRYPGHSRVPSAESPQRSPPMPSPIASIGETLAASHQKPQVREQNVFTVDKPKFGKVPSPTPTPVLPELQHLYSPPPPPPPPSLFRGSTATGISSQGVINIGIDSNNSPPAYGDSPRVYSTSTQSSRTGTPAVHDPNLASSPAQGHRRGRGSVSETVGQKLRSVRDRIRSTSRGRNNMSPGNDALSAGASPYESVPPPFTFPPTGSRTMSPNNAEPNSPERPYTSHGGGQAATPHPEVTIPAGPGVGVVMGPESSPGPASAGAEQRGPRPNLPYQGYRNPKEIRANMPPDQLQLGVTNSAYLAGGMAPTQGGNG